MSKEREGWWWPSNARRAHYMRGHRSLCGQWAQGGDTHRLGQWRADDADTCAECRRRLAKEQESTR